MAVNPMQRKARNSFLLGMLIMLVIGAIVGTILYMQIMKLKQAEQQRVANSTDIYVLTEDVKSGAEITGLKKVSIESKIATSDIATPSDLDEYPVAKIDIPKGAFLSKSMITTAEEKTTKDLRIEEFNMILLPSDLAENDFVDIRLRLSNGQNYIVLAKKRILQASQNTIFLKLTEEEILTMSNAIVESYISSGSLLEAVKYETAGIQEAATPTYNVSQAVYNLIQTNPNIVENAKSALNARYRTDRRQEVETILSQSLEGAEAVQSGVDEQIQKQQIERAKYVDGL